jgi:hypothetical protein
LYLVSIIPHSLSARLPSQRNATVNNKYFIWGSVLVTGSILMRQNQRLLRRVRAMRMALLGRRTSPLSKFFFK